MVRLRFDLRLLRLHRPICKGKAGKGTVDAEFPFLLKRASDYIPLMN